MSQKAGGRSTVPQIWIGETHVGGCDDLYSLEREGKLDMLLAA
jgi:glutaredoxin 3